MVQGQRYSRHEGREKGVPAARRMDAKLRAFLKGSGRTTEGEMGIERTPHFAHPSPNYRDGRPEVVRIRLLGGFEVSLSSRTIEERAWRLKKAAALIKLLALAPGHRMHREQAMDLLWPGLGKKPPSNNLRQVLYTARRALGSDSHNRYLSLRDEQIALCPGGQL
jgi:DNA-binding response OmpR family regulator